MKKRFGDRGVALIVLATMILAVGLLVYIILQGLKSNLGFVKNKDTYDKLGVIKKAITRFVLDNGRFPCPAPLNSITGDSDFGAEQYTANYQGCETSSGGVFESTTSNSYYGAVPTRDLGLSDHYMIDKWNNKISYVVDKTFVLKDALNTILENGDTGDITVSGIAGSSGSEVIYVLISFGKNAVGAYDKDSSVRNQGTPCDSSNVLDVSDQFDEIFVGNINCNFLVMQNKTTFINETQVEEEVQSCPEEASVSVPISGTLSSWSTTFPAARYDEKVYSVDACPISVTSPAAEADYYYISTNEYNKVGRTCGRNGEWESGFSPTCTEVNKCTRPATLNSRAVTWDDTDTFAIVESGSITGTFDDDSTAFTVTCTDENLYLTSGDPEFTCTSADLDGEVTTSLHATWDTGSTYHSGDTATATGCDSGYSENAGGAATIDCVADGWDEESLANACLPDCKQNYVINPTYEASEDRTPVYNSSGTTLMKYELGNFAYAGNISNDLSGDRARICQIGESGTPFYVFQYMPDVGNIFSAFTVDSADILYCGEEYGDIDTENSDMTFICSTDESGDAIFKNQVATVCNIASATTTGGTFTSVANAAQTAVAPGVQLDGSCNSGYTEVGTLTATCQSNGTWSVSGSCTPSSCTGTLAVSNWDCVCFDDSCPVPDTFAVSLSLGTQTHGTVLYNVGSVVAAKTLTTSFASSRPWKCDYLDVLCCYGDWYIVNWGRYHYWSLAWHEWDVLWYSESCSVAHAAITGPF